MAKVLKKEDATAKKAAISGKKRLRAKREEEKPLPDGYYIYYPDRKVALELKARRSVYGDTEYAYRGEMLPGRVEVLHVENGNAYPLPHPGEWNYGFTLEGEAHSAFHASAALTRYNPTEDRSFVYINLESELFYTREDTKVYDLSIRLFGDNGEAGDRWVVLYMGEAK